MNFDVRIVWCMWDEYNVRCEPCVFRILRISYGFMKKADANEQMVADCVCLSILLSWNSDDSKSLRKLK